MSNIGIWLDKQHAWVVTHADGSEILEIIESDLEFFNPRGGSRTRSAKWGPQDVVQDSRYLEREKHQMNDYFNRIGEKIKNAENIVLYGPADTNRKLEAHLADNPLFTGKVMAAIKADSMTQNQFKALVRDFFENHKK